MAEELPSAIDDNPFLEDGDRPNARQAVIWDTKFIIKRQRETGLHLRELVNFYKEYVPGVVDFSIRVDGKRVKYINLSERDVTAFSRMRERQDMQIARMKAERMGNGNGQTKLHEKEQTKDN